MSDFRYGLPDPFRVSGTPEKILKSSSIHSDIRIVNNFAIVLKEIPSGLVFIIWDSDWSA